MGTNYEYLGSGNDDGTIVGRSGEGIGFLGATPVTIQPITSVAITTASTTTASYGATSAAEYNALAECVRRMRVILVALGLMEYSSS